MDLRILEIASNTENNKILDKDSANLKTKNINNKSKEKIYNFSYFKKPLE